MKQTAASRLVAGVMVAFVLAIVGIVAISYMTAPPDESTVDATPPPLPGWSSSSRVSVEGVPHYTRHDGGLKPVAEMNIESGDWTYLKTETPERVNLQIEGDVLTIPTANTVFKYTETKISPIITYSKAGLAAAETTINATYGYITFPYSLSGKAITSNTSISFGKFRFDAGNDHITITGSEKTELNKAKHDFRIVEDEIRLYYDKAAIGKLSGDVTFEMHSWSVNSDIISGLTDVGARSTPSVFQKDGTWYLIAGEYHGAFNGFNWTGSAWQTDNDIISGLADVGQFSTPSVFQKDGTWYLIAGENDGAFNGWDWTGSTWQTNNTIISGLTGVESQSTPDVFQKDSTWYLIAGEHDGLFNGWDWTGSTWQTNNTIISGLTAAGGGQSRPDVFQKNSTWYLIAGAHDGKFDGWNWTGSTWQSDSDIVSGLADVGWQSTPDVFQKDGTWYLIAGEDSGVFNGWNLQAPATYIPPNPTTLANTTSAGWVNYTWSAGSGNVTDSYRVYHNGVWDNSSSNTYKYSEVGGGNWSNITVYAWNSSASGTLSAGSVSDQVTAPQPPVPYTPPDPVNLANTTGNFWVNHTWDAGSGNVTDSYNVLQNGTWHNSTANPYYNATSVGAHGYSDITVYAYNSSASGTLSANNITQNTTLSNNPITITNTSGWGGIPGGNVYVDYDATDADGDNPTFSCNRTDLFTDFSTATGVGNWIFTGGTLYVDFGVSDGYGSTSNYTMTISEEMSAKPPSPVNLQHTTGNFWVHHTWQAGSGNVTDSYRVLVNSVWHNSSANPYYNDTYSAHAWQNITVYAWNSSGAGTLSD